MGDYLPFLVIGITAGGVYALAAMGLVLTYATSGVFNFAHGAVGMFATYIFYTLRVEQNLPTPLAMAAAVLVVAPLMGVLIDRVLLRRLQGSPPAASVVASIGLLVALQGLTVAIYGSTTRQMPPIFPTRTYRLPGVNVGMDQTIVLAVSVLVGIGLALLLRSTHFGLKTRAVVGDPELAALVGTDPRGVTTRSWMLGSALAALAGVLFSPFVQLDSIALTLLVVQAFGAAIIGRLRSLPLANLGAYLVAIAAALISKFVASKPALAGLPTSLPFLVLFAVLVGSRKGSFEELVDPRARGRSGRRAAVAGRRFPVVSLVGLGVVAVLLPFVLSSNRLLTATSTLAFVLVFSSLSLLLGLSRQVSLCHAVFVVFGATTFSHLLTAGLPWLLALVGAGLLIVPVGALVAIPAIRLSGLFLALATFGFGVLAQYFIFPSGLAFGRDAYAGLARPQAVASDTRYYYVVLAVVAVGVIAVEVIRVTRLGRILRILADSPLATQSLGVDPTAARVIVFCCSAFLAALSGGLIGGLVQIVTPGSFDFFQSLVWPAVLVTAGAATLAGSVLAAVLLVAVPSFFGFTVTEWLPVVFGTSAVIMAQAPNGIVGFVSSLDLDGLKSGGNLRLDGARRAERFLAAARTP
jgi:branched-subunit amino acid ABC-type transport system permease component